MLQLRYKIDITNMYNLYIFSDNFLKICNFFLMYIQYIFQNFNQGKKNMFIFNIYYVYKILRKIYIECIQYIMNWENCYILYLYV